METTIILGGVEYQIGRLTLGQMSQVGPCFARMSMDTVDGMRAQATIIYHGVKAANPAFKMEELDAIPGVTFDELRVAVEKIAVNTGLTLKKPGTDSGEAKPATEQTEEPASADGTGDTFTLN